MIKRFVTAILFVVAIIMVTRTFNWFIPTPTTHRNNLCIKGSLLGKSDLVLSAYSVHLLCSYLNVVWSSINAINHFGFPITLTYNLTSNGILIALGV
jgi:hypothetical protein